jgi:hypothetical protein
MDKYPSPQKYRRPNVREAPQKGQKKRDLGYIFKPVPDKHEKTKRMGSFVIAGFE